MAREKRQEIIDFILNKIKSKLMGMNPSQEVSKKFNISRQQATRYLTYLVLQGVLTKIGTSGSGVIYILSSSDKESFKPLASVNMTRAKSAKIGEDKLYSIYIYPFTAQLNEQLQVIIKHGFTEMVNNVIDHSKATKLFFKFCENGKDYQLVIDDNGVGIFKKNKQAFKTATLLEAIAETAKGRRTSAPTTHSGEGIFFTSRLFDKFFIEANGYIYEYISAIDDWAITESQRVNQGTKIIMNISRKSKRQALSVFNQYTDESLIFNKKGRFLVQPYAITVGKDPISRSEAKRLLNGAENFIHIIVDFKNATFVGQGFADEVFRVFQNAHPKTLIEPINMNEIATFMVTKSRK